MSRLLIISNRLPFSIERQNNEVKLRQSSGGLVSAIKSYFEKNKAEDNYTSKIWLGRMDSSEEDWTQVKETGQLPEDFSIEPVFPDSTAYSNYYNGFSNSTLWPLMHYFPSLVEYKKEYFEDYKKINQLFADRIIEIYQPGDVIWVHDYQLM